MTPSTAWREAKSEGEDAAFERYAAVLGRTQAPQRRALHNKQHLGIRAEFTVLPDLPEHARHGLFATPATYGAYVRISNGDPRSRPDRKPDLRGFAIKVVGVKGKKIIPGLEDAVTQDFLMIPTRALAVRTAEEFIAFFEMAQNPLTLLPKMILRFGLLRTFRILGSFAKNAKAPPSLFAIPYFSGAAIQCGPYASRYAVFPRGAAAAGSDSSAPGYLREEALARLASAPIELDFRMQFFVDDTRTPIEAHDVEWRESDASFVTVARLTLLGEANAERVEAMSFDPWHALEAHRPLGNVMRARNVAYRESTKARGAGPEPTHID